MKHYLENIDEVCRDVKTGVDGKTRRDGIRHCHRARIFNYSDGRVG